MNGKSQIAPLISSSMAGPCGIMHLPRLWSKLLLHATGRLPPDYRHGEGGLDELVCTHFGVDRAAFVAYVETDKPGYRDAERHFVERATDTTPQRIAEFNVIVIERRFPDPERARVLRARFGIEDDSYMNAISLNDLDDWALFHELLLPSE